MVVLNRQNPIPIYQQLAEILRQKILAGEYSPGNPLPSENKLVAIYQVSRDSVRRAIQLLVNAGIVQRVHGKGNFVRDIQSCEKPEGIIAFLVPDTRVFLFMNLFNGMINAARMRGYSVTFCYLGHDETEERFVFNQLQEQGVNGFIIFPQNKTIYDVAIAELIPKGFPFTLVDRYLPQISCSFVGIDNVSAGFQATEYLIKIGHREIGFVSNDIMETTSVEDRFQGYLNALHTYGIKFREEFLIKSPSSYASPIFSDEAEQLEINTYRRLFHERKLPTALFCINDMTAYLVSHAAIAEGLRIPQDLAIIGFDDDDYARRAPIPLTTIFQPFQEIGARAAHLLIDTICGTISSFERILLPTHLVIRQSCGSRTIVNKTNDVIYVETQK